MTTPSKAQLAFTVPPLTRDYIDAAIAEAIAKAQMDYLSLEATVLSSANAVNTALARVNLLEAEVHAPLNT